MPSADASLLAKAGIIGVLILLEGLLSADNALVIALLVKHLPPRQRRNALLVGLIGSFSMRLVAILLAQTLVRFWYLQGLGALYLLYLPYRHFRPKPAGPDGRPLVAKKHLGFWPTVAVVEFTDLVFAVDSILVAVTLSREPLIIWIGGISGVVLLRFAAFVLVRVLDVMPGLEHVAYVLVAWVGIKLALMSLHSFNEYYEKGWGWPVREMNPWVFWIGTGLILIVGTWLSRRKPSEMKRDWEKLE